MQLLTNFDESSNHHTVVRRLAAAADEMVVLSPYISRDLQRILSKFLLEELTGFRLITTLEPLQASQLWTVDGLQSLREYFRTFSTRVALTIQIAPQLHGKVYLFQQRGEPFAAIISSANFTDNGLRTNAEWGVAVRDPRILSELAVSVGRLLTLDLSDTDLDALIEATANYRSLHPSSGNEGVGLDLTKVLQQSPAQLSTGWLKPSGVSDDPVLEGQSYGDIEQDLHFSKVRPTGVSVGDVMVVYGVGARRLLSVFEVTDSPAEATPEEVRLNPWKSRWPWYVPATNLTPRFGATWWHHDLYVTALSEEYLAQNPNAPITAVGGQTLGALNYGADKVRLDRAFADWLVSKVRRIEEALAAAPVQSNGSAAGA